jgi:ABC-type transport system involved in cytochrome c biogenesis permease subunit
LAYTLLCIGLRGYVGGHIPMSNGSETMMFMSACAMVLTLCLQRRFTLVVPFGYIISGLTLMVSSFGESNPQITHLMPVLASPLLSIHVCVLMLAYTLLAFIMLNGIAAIVVGRNNPEQVDTLYIVSKLMLYPALFLLTAGIFIGAIWANQSWGRYWGWDPKEVWALITMLIYAMPLHPSLFPRLQKPMAAHIFLVAAFLSVLITYFGVNFLLGGMHSYA